MIQVSIAQHLDCDCVYCALHSIHMKCSRLLYMLQNISIVWDHSKISQYISAITSGELLVHVRIKLQRLYLPTNCMETKREQANDLVVPVTWGHMGGLERIWPYSSVFLHEVIKLKIQIHALALGVFRLLPLP